MELCREHCSRCHAQSRELQVCSDRKRSHRARQGDTPSGVPTAEQGARPPSHPDRPTKLQGAAPWGSGTQRHEGIVTSWSYNTNTTKHTRLTSTTRDTYQLLIHITGTILILQAHTPPQKHVTTILTLQHYYTITRLHRAPELTYNSTAPSCP